MVLLGYSSHFGDAEHLILGLHLCPFDYRFELVGLVLLKVQLEHKCSASLLDEDIQIGPRPDLLSEELKRKAT